MDWLIALIALCEVEAANKNLDKYSINQRQCVLELVMCTKAKRQLGLLAADYQHASARCVEERIKAQWESTKEKEKN